MKTKPLHPVLLGEFDLSGIRCFAKVKTMLERGGLELQDP